MSQQELIEYYNDKGVSKFAPKEDILSEILFKDWANTTILRIIKILTLPKTAELFSCRAISVMIGKSLSSTIEAVSKLKNEGYLVESFGRYRLKLPEILAGESDRKTDQPDEEAIGKPIGGDRKTDRERSENRSECDRKTDHRIIINNNNKNINNECEESSQNPPQTFSSEKVNSELLNFETYPHPALEILNEPDYSVKVSQAQYEQKLKELEANNVNPEIIEKFRLNARVQSQKYKLIFRSILEEQNLAKKLQGTGLDRVEFKEVFEHFQNWAEGKLRSKKKSDRDMYLSISSHVGAINKWVIGAVLESKSKQLDHKRKKSYMGAR